MAPHDLENVRSSEDAHAEPVQSHAFELFTTGNVELLELPMEIFSCYAGECDREHLVRRHLFLEKPGDPTLHCVRFAGSRPCNHPDAIACRRSNLVRNPVLIEVLVPRHPYPRMSKPPVAAAGTYHRGKSACNCTFANTTKALRSTLSSASLLSIKCRQPCQKKSDGPPMSMILSVRPGLGGFDRAHLAHMLARCENPYFTALDDDGDGPGENQEYVVVLAALREQIFTGA
jgi:hypothetical protein